MTFSFVAPILTCVGREDAVDGRDGEERMESGLGRVRRVGVDGTRVRTIIKLE